MHDFNYLSDLRVLGRRSTVLVQLHLQPLAWGLEMSVTSVGLQCPGLQQGGVGGVPGPGGSCENIQPRAEGFGP